MKQPTINVVIATYNSENTIGKCLASVRSQKYPQEKISIYICDGGSTDKTKNIIKKYNVKLINVPKDKQNAEYNKAVGVQKVRGKFVLFIDHDNVLPHKKWLTNMLAPLLEDESIVASETLKYHYDPSYSFLDRYFALLGAGDPVAFYLGKADRLSYLYDDYNLFGKAEDKGEYYRVEFEKNKIPTLGANGFLIRSDLLKKESKSDLANYFHIDINVDLIRKGYNVYAFTKDTVIHFTGYKKLSSFLYRRKLFMEQYYIQPYSARRYSVYEPQDFWRLILFVIFAVTFVKPTYDALRGFMRYPDTAWFLHPILSFTLVCIYGWVIISSEIKKRFS